MKTYKLIGKIVSVDGMCTAGHKVGEKFDLSLYSENETIRRAPSICGFFYDVLFPYVATLQFGGDFPWEKDKNMFRVGCPDNNKVIMEIKRVRI